MRHLLSAIATTATPSMGVMMMCRRWEHRYREVELNNC
jgi:hypothetical protein